MTPKAVCFDLDGTLLDTLADLATSMNHALERLGLLTHPTDAYRTFVGAGMAMRVQRVAPAAGDDADLAARLLTEMRREYANRWADTTRPYDGVPELLDALQARSLPMAVLSNKPHDFTEKCVARLLARWSFARVFGVRDDVPPKPDPTGARRVARELEIAPEAFLYVGDTGTDMATARAAGMLPVGVTWGFRDADELRQAGAKHLIDDPSELMGLVDAAPSPS